MNNVSKTLYIPLYGKAMVSRRGIILRDSKAEEIWEREQFPLKGKSRSRWLSYFMAMRARVFDDWTAEKLREFPQAAVLHIGCGMDSRFLRVGGNSERWYDIDFPEVISERGKYYSPAANYAMLGCDVSKPEQLKSLPSAPEAIVILEGISMYLEAGEVSALLEGLRSKYAELRVLMDVYTEFGAKASRFKNPINDVGVTAVHGIDDPCSVLKSGGLRLIAEHSMTPKPLVDELRGFERFFFRHVFSGKFAKRIYRLYEYGTAGSSPTS